MILRSIGTPNKTESPRNTRRLSDDLPEVEGAVDLVVQVAGVLLELLELLDALEEGGWLLAIATGKSDRGLRHCLDLHDIHASDLRPKPDPYGYRMLCDRFGIDPPPKFHDHETIPPSRSTEWSAPTGPCRRTGRA